MTDLLVVQDFSRDVGSNHGVGTRVQQPLYVWPLVRRLWKLEHHQGSHLRMQLMPLSQPQINHVYQDRTVYLDKYSNSSAQIAGVQSRGHPDDPVWSKAHALHLLIRVHLGFVPLPAPAEQFTSCDQQTAPSPTLFMAGNGTSHTSDALYSSTGLLPQHV